MQIHLPGLWSTAAFLHSVDATEALSKTRIPNSLRVVCVSHSAHPAPLLPSLTPIKGHVCAKAVTSAALEQRGPTSPACQLPDESWSVLWNYDKNSASRGRPPIPAHFASCTGRTQSKLEKRVVSMLALVGGLRDLWTVGGDTDVWGDCVYVERDVKPRKKKDKPLCSE